MTKGPADIIHTHVVRIYIVCVYPNLGISDWRSQFPQMEVGRQDEVKIFSREVATQFSVFINFQATLTSYAFNIMLSCGGTMFQNMGEARRD